MPGSPVLGFDIGVEAERHGPAINFQIGRDVAPRARNNTRFATLADVLGLRVAGDADMQYVPFDLGFQSLHSTVLLLLGLTSQGGYCARLSCLVQL